MLDNSRSFFRSVNPLTLLLMALTVVYANGLFNHGLIPSMEPRFAEVISEMMGAHQYLIPIKNGVPYVEYPPLLYWLSILFAKLGFPIEAAIRLPCYISFIVWVLYVSKLQNLLFKDLPRYIMPVLAAALPAILWHFFTAQSDSLLITGVLIAFVGFAKLRLGVTESRFPWEIWLGVSFATAAKGPVGIACTLPVMMLEMLLAAIASRHKDTPVSGVVADLINQLKSLAWARGLTLLALTILPWYLAAGYYFGWDYVRAVFIYQNFDRYISGLGGHHQPWWYYFGAVLAGLFPLSLFVPVGIWVAMKKLRDMPHRLVLSWALFTFIFFSISASKQGKYILPATPAFVALGIFGIGSVFKPSLDQSLQLFRRWAVGMLVLWGLAVVLILPFYAGKIAHVGGFSVIRDAIAEKPGGLVSFGWPRSLALYELGSPMNFVRSSRELYEKIASGEIPAGSYLMVADSDLAKSADLSQVDKLVPFPREPWLEYVLSVKAENKVELFRVLPDAGLSGVPPTPEPAKLNWRDAKFDTD